MERRNNQHRKDNDPNNSQIPPTYLHVPPTVPPRVPPETYNHLINALLSLQGSASQSYPPTYQYPFHPGPPPNYGHPWPPSHVPPGQTPPLANPSSYYPPPISVPPHVVSLGAGPSQPTASLATVTPTAQDLEGSEDAISSAEDKRRRNTAASARFRVKKKLKSLDLEHTVTDLTGRTEELEREAADLRRENTWLKEIVVLKGRHLAASNVAPSAPTGREDEDGKDESESETSVHQREKGKDKAN